MELEKVKRSLLMNRDAYDAVRRVLRPGITERQVFAAIEEAYEKNAGFRPKCIYDLVSGERAGAVSGEATDRILNEGDCLIADLLPCFEGNWCDTTRTFFVGEPTPAWEKAYAAIVEALRAGEATLRAKARAGDIFDAVDWSLKAQGYIGLVHHAGHAVGDSEQEEPDFVRGGEGRIESGMVVTLEPGIYVEGENGIRIENNYLITDDGFTPLFDYPEEIHHFIAAF